MAIALLRTLTGQIPNWQKRLQLLASESTSRQIELAELEKSASQLLIPPLDAVETMTTESMSATQLPAVTTTMTMDAAISTGSQQQITKSSNTLRPLKPPKSEPIYFDGSMQKYFEELVHFVAVSRNTMRKARMSARAAHMKKKALSENKDELNDDSLEAHGLGYINSRRYESSLYAMPGKGSSRPAPTPGCEAFDALDKKLDSLQSTSELAAFQFLRDASCTKHVQTVMKILADLLEASTAELARLQKEEPDLIRDADAVVAAACTKRPLSVRNELSTEAQTAESPSKRQNMGPLVSSPSIPRAEHMEIDHTGLQNDEPIAPRTVQLQATLPT